MEQFCKHHKNKFIKIHLHDIDQIKYIINNLKHFQYYFNTVDMFHI